MSNAIGIKDGIAWNIEFGAVRLYHGCTAAHHRGAGGGPDPGQQERLIHYREGVGNQLDALAGGGVGAAVRRRRRGFEVEAPDAD